MVPLKEAREKLYKMLEHNFVQVQEIPKSSDHVPARTIYLFNVNIEQVAQIIKADFYKTLKNLKMRLQHHLKQSQVVCERSKLTK